MSSADSKPAAGALVEAIDAQDFEKAKALLDLGADPNDKGIGNNKDKTALHMAMYKSSVEMVELLIARGADVNKCNFQGYTTLGIATSAGKNEEVRLKMIDLLLDNGARIDQKNHIGFTALMYAVGYESIATIAKLIARGADLDITNDTGRTAEAIAEFNKTPEIAKMLRDAPAERLRIIRERKSAEAAALKRSHDRAADKQKRLRRMIKKDLRPKRP